MGAALAQDIGGRPFGRGAEGRGDFSPPGFAALDSNRDGKMSVNEIDAASAVLTKLDKNRDGKLDAEELRATMPERPERGRGGAAPGEAGGNVTEETVRTLLGFDANGDGKLSASELPDRMRGIFARADGDRDGFLTQEELRILAVKQAGQQPAGGPEPGRRNMGMARMDPVLAVVDTDHDGTLSEEEIRHAPKAIRTLDSNRDSTVTREEAMPAARRRMGPGRRERGRDIQ